MHWVNEGGLRRRRSTLELILLFLRKRSLEDNNVKAFRAFHRLLEKYGPQEPQNGAGYLIVPEPVTEKEWEEKYCMENNDGGGFE